MLKAFSVLFLFLMFVSSAYAEIYRIVDENGVVTFTDRSTPGKKDGVHASKKIEIKNNFINPLGANTADKLGRFSVKEKKPLRYKQFSILSPKNDIAIRSNTGSVELKLKIFPALQTKFGHQIKVELDGQLQQSSWKTNTILFTSLDRGTHVFRAYIVDKSKKRLKSSQSVEFHLQRFSQLFKSP